MTFDEQVDKFTSLLAETLKKKNADYGDSFNQQYKKYGMTSSLIRLEDKQRRLENLILNGNQQVDESIDDTLLDLCGYSLLTLISREDEQSPAVKKFQEKFNEIENRRETEKEPRIIPNPYR